MIASVLRKPRPLPQRFNRAVTPLTRRLVEKRHQMQRQYKHQRWKRALQRFERRLIAMRGILFRFAIVLIVGLAILLVCIALFSPILKVRVIRVARTDLRLDNELIQKSLASLFTRRMPVLSAEEIPPLLTTVMPDIHRSAVPDLTSVTITKVYPSTLQLRIQLKPLAYRLLIDAPDQQTPTPPPASGSGSDFLTADGMYVVYRNTQTGTGSGLPTIHIVDWGVRPNPWQPLLSGDMLTAMHEAGRALGTEFHQAVLSRTIFLRAREIHLKLAAYDVWFDLKSSIPEQIDRYRLFLKNVPAGTAKQYVDLRVRGKVVYR